MEKFNFFKRNKDKVKGAVVGAGLMMGALGAQAQEEIKTPYDTMPNPITATIDLDDINVFQETYPLEVNKNQAEWGEINRDYYLSGRKYGLQVNFNEDEIKIPEGLSITQLLYYLKGIEEGVKKFEESGQERDFTKHRLTEKERQAKIKKGQNKMKAELNKRAGTCGIGKAQRKNLKSYY